MTGVPVSMTPVVSDNASGLLESLLNWSFPKSMSHTSVLSDGTFYSASDSPPGQTPVLRSIQMFGWEGPFEAQIPHPRIGDSAGGCAFRCTTLRISDFAPASGEFGLPLHHPRFLEWIGAQESTRLLDRGPDAWFRSLSHTQSIDAAHQYIVMCAL